jgi:carboxyl-terminal processing protease
MKKVSRIFLAVLLFLFILGGNGQLFCQASQTGTNHELIDEKLLLFVQVFGAIQKYHVDENKSDKLIYPAIKAMVNQLDPYSRFLTPEEKKKEDDSRKDMHEYSGVGAVFGYCQSSDELKKDLEEKKIDINDISYEVKKVFKDSPAEKAGLLPKDKILAIDGMSVKDIAAGEITKASGFEKVRIKFKAIGDKIMGETGTVVILTINRGGLRKPKDISIIRQKIQTKNVEWRIISEGVSKIGYFSLRDFSSPSTVKDVAIAVDNFKTEGVSGVIFDLRENGGGLVDNCIGILDEFLPPNSLVITEKGRIEGETLYTHPNAKNYDIPLVILIDNGTASASEVASGVLRDYKRAILIGEKTYGKGCVQIPIDLSDGSRLVLTIYNYFLPSGELIHKKGILPHIEMKTDFDEPLINEAIKVISDWQNYKEKYLK